MPWGESHILIRCIYICVCVCVCVCLEKYKGYVWQWRTQLRTEDREDGDLGAVAP